jgi:hypothetical protein
MRKEYWTDPSAEHSTKHLTNIPQNCQGHQKEGKVIKLSQPRAAKEDLLVKELGVLGHKKTSGENHSNINRAEMLIKYISFNSDIL